jgi:hypothetical protein
VILVLQKLQKDRADIVARVFKMKLDKCMHDLMHKQIIGRLAGISMVSEYNLQENMHGSGSWVSG